MKELKEQITYMEDEVNWYQNKVDSGRDGWVDTLEMCKSILRTLKLIPPRIMNKCPHCHKWFEVKKPNGRKDKKYCSNACRSAAYRKRITN